MNILSGSLTFACLLFTTVVTATADPVISEFMASNATTLKDGEYLALLKPDGLTATTNPHSPALRTPL